MLAAVIEFLAQAATDGLAQTVTERRKARRHQPPTTAAWETIPCSLRDPENSPKWSAGLLEVRPTALVWRPLLGRAKPLHLRRLGTICVSRRESVPEELADGYTVRLECNGRVVDLAIDRDHVNQLDVVLSGTTPGRHGCVR